MAKSSPPFENHFKSLPFVVLLSALLLTFLAWRYGEKRTEQKNKIYFDHQAARASEAVLKSIESYSNTLYDVQALFIVSGDVSRAQWDRYMASLELKNRFPGMHNLSFARFIPSGARTEYEKKMKSGPDNADYAIFPSGPRKDYFPIELQAFGEEGKREYGFDIAGDPVRREGIERAIETGRPAATARSLISPAKIPGFCIRLPVYRTGMPHGTADERRSALIGVASIVFTMDKLINTVLASQSSPDIDLEIYDLGPASAPLPVSAVASDPGSYLLYDRDGNGHFTRPGYHPLFEMTAPIDIAGERWLFYNSTNTLLQIGSETNIPRAIAFAGFVVSVLLFGMTWTLVNSRSRAVAMANVMTSELRESEEKFRSLTETASDAILTTDKEGLIIYMNRGGVSLLGYEQNELIGEHFSKLIPEGVRSSNRDALLNDLTVGEIFQKRKPIELNGLRKDRSEVPVELSLTRWKNEQGTFYTAIIRDVTERKKTEQSLSQKNAFVQLLYVVTMATNESSTLEEALQTCLNEICGHMGWSVGHVYFKSGERERTLCPSTLWFFDAPAEFAGFKMLTEKTYLQAGEELPGTVLESGEPSFMIFKPEREEKGRLADFRALGIRSGFAIPILVRDEVVAALEFYSKSAREPDGSTLEVMAHIGTQLGRVIERKKAKEELDFMATHDPLSNLPNRTLFYDRLEKAIANAKRNNCMAAVFFVDLDQFKRINDTLGHTIGDFALREVAKRLHHCVRAGDTVARWGGDEFTLLFENITRVENLVRISHKILDAISQPILVEEKEIHLSTSIGITISPHDGDNVELLLKNADIAMYRAKDKGRNTFQFYSQEMSVDSSQKLELENQLRHAIERKEFILHYQPLFNLRSEKIVGAEALIRWNHPTLGMVPPSKFIPLAEETGLIVSIGEWVLKTACAQSKAWQEMGLPPIRIAVNLSARQFQRSGIVELVRKCLKETRLSPRDLELELTESILMQKTDEMISTLGRLHEMGIHISIDDFGTGYSSLSYIKKFPIDTLKIDQSFVREITTNKDDAALSSAIIAMAHSLNLNVIAEAVETAEQLEFFKSHGCNEIQGYLISPPLPPDVFRAFLHEKSLTRAI
jgi:diguanylate cyclase (GGDEF)-like protein/PAS domain S-box-containing protein